MNKQFFTFLWADNKEAIDRFSRDAIQEMRGISHLNGLPLTIVDVATQVCDPKRVILPLHIDDLKDMMVSLNGASTTLFLSGAKRRDNGINYFTVLCHAVEGLDWENEDNKIKEKGYLVARQLSKKIQKVDRLTEATAVVRDMLNSFAANAMAKSEPSRPFTTALKVDPPPGRRLN